jgi:hypothetical protein
MTNAGGVPRKFARCSWVAGGLLVTTAVAVTIAASVSAGAATVVGLGTAGSFGVLAGTTVTNTGTTVVNGDLGVSPGTAVTGFPPGIVHGIIHKADGVAAGAQSALVTAYNNAAGQSPSGSVGHFIGAGQTLGPGVYNASSSLDVGGSLTLDAQGDPDAVFIFQVGSTLVTDSSSSVVLTDGAQACNVFWQVGSSATLGTDSAFQGSILALQSISVTVGDTIQGRALARNGAVTLDDDVITVPACTTTTPTPTPTMTTPTPTPTMTTPTPTPTMTTPTPTPTMTTPTPTPTMTTPTPTPTMTTPSPSPTRHHHKHHPAPAPRPTPVPITFPVTG